MKTLRLAAASVLLCAAGLACAQTYPLNYPVRPIRLIVPFPPGGGNDTVARAIADQASPALGQPIVVDNRPGAAGIIGADLAAKAPPDGYTLFLGIAGTQSAGLMAAQYGAMVKRMHAGRSSQSGLYGALLAERGFTGIENVFESEYGGFCTTFSRSTDRFDLSQLTAGLGSVWQTMGVALKFYACVGSNHTTLDALRALQAEHRFVATDVERIDVHGSQVTADHVGWKYEPKGLTAAQLNLPFCVATFLLEGDCFVDQFSDAVVHDPRRIALSERVHVHADPAITARGAKHRHAVRVEVHLKNGKRLDRSADTPRGGDANFAADADIVEKFEKLAVHALPKTRVANLRDAVLRLEHLADTAELAALMQVV